MPNDLTNLVPPNNLPEYNIHVGGFFTANDGKANSAFIIEAVNTTNRTFRAIKLSSMAPYREDIPFRIDKERRNPFRESIQVMTYGAGISYLEHVLGEAHQELKFWKSLQKAYRNWRASRLDNKAFLKRYQQGPLKALQKLRN